MSETIVIVSGSPSEPFKAEVRIATYSRIIRIDSFVRHSLWESVFPRRDLLIYPISQALSRLRWWPICHLVA